MKSPSNSGNHPNKIHFPRGKDLVKDLGILGATGLVTFGAVKVATNSPSQAPSAHSIKGETVSGSLAYPDSANALVEDLKAGNGNVLPLQTIYFRPKTVIYTSPEDESQAGGGASNVYETVPKGHNLEITGAVIDIDPNSGVNGKSIVTFTLAGSNQLLFTPNDLNYIAGTANPSSTPGVSYSDKVNFSGNQMYVDQYQGGNTESVPIGLGSIVPVKPAHQERPLS